MHRYTLIVSLLVTLARTLVGQQSGGSVSGTLVDSAGRAVSDAQVALFPGGREVRTQPDGSFSFGAVAGGTYTVRARRVGYAPVATTVTVASDAVRLRLIFARRLPVLDTVVVAARRECSRLSLDGFVCRRGNENGTFLDYMDIAAKNAAYRGDLFRGVDGFRVTYRPVWGAPEPVPIETSEKGARCAKYLVNGKTPHLVMNPMPEVANIVAVEIYNQAIHVPDEYMLQAWPPANHSTRAKGPPAAACALVVYWTTDARTTPRSP
jgi:xanthine/CO dehydrogenase XdhC/CoxF family maturation factor